MLDFTQVTSLIFDNNEVYSLLLNGVEVWTYPIEATNIPFGVEIPITSGYSTNMVLGKYSYFSEEITASSENSYTVLLARYGYFSCEIEFQDLNITSEFMLCPTPLCSIDIEIDSVIENTMLLADAVFIDGLNIEIVSDYEINSLLATALLTGYHLDMLYTQSLDMLRCNVLFTGERERLKWQENIDISVFQANVTGFKQNFVWGQTTNMVLSERIVFSQSLNFEFNEEYSVSLFDTAVIDCNIPIENQISYTLHLFEVISIEDLRINGVLSQSQELRLMDAISASVFIQNDTFDVTLSSYILPAKSFTVEVQGESTMFATFTMYKLATLQDLANLTLSDVANYTFETTIKIS